MADVGGAADREGIRISRCQLGLFGYSDFGTKGLAKALLKTPDALASAIRAQLVDGKLPCAATWRIAQAAGLPRIAVACACETLGVRIAPCQLGCF
jgi:hypothetical protein